MKNANIASLLAAYTANTIVMDFVTTEALEQVAADIRAKTGGGTTAKGVEVLMITDASVAGRVEQYIRAGLAAVVAQHISQHASA